MAKKTVNKHVYHQSHINKGRTRYAFKFYLVKINTLHIVIVCVLFIDPGSNLNKSSIIIL